MPRPEVSDELRDLMERNGYIQELTQHPGWELLQDSVRHALQKKQEWLILGYADNMEEYRENVGWNKGVLYVFEMPKKLDAEVQRREQEEREAHGREESTE